MHTPHGGIAVPMGYDIAADAAKASAAIRTFICVVICVLRQNAECFLSFSLPLVDCTARTPLARSDDLHFSLVQRYTFGETCTPSDFLRSSNRE